MTITGYAGLKEVLAALESYRERHLVPSYFMLALARLRAIVKESDEALDEAIRVGSSLQRTDH